MNVLARGFAVARKDGQVLRDAARVRVGDRVRVRLHRGELDCRVEGRLDGRIDGKGRAGP
jgi:exodeoxyribonuclease VII large subunit